VPVVINAFEESHRRAVVMLWSLLMSFLADNWSWVTAILVGILVLSAIQAFTTRWWGWFGSVLYNYAFFGTMFLIGLLVGPEFFASIWHDIVGVILYPACFLAIRWILINAGLYRPRPRWVRN
jgi:uncharacterized membrane protein AbrB (regulator of aidB expression)